MMLYRHGRKSLLAVLLYNDKGQARGGPGWGPKVQITLFDLGAGHVQSKIASPGPKNTPIPGALGYLPVPTVKPMHL